jgi:hypothetical protein
MRHDRLLRLSLARDLTDNGRERWHVAVADSLDGCSRCVCSESDDLTSAGRDIITIGM